MKRHNKVREKLKRKKKRFNDVITQVPYYVIDGKMWLPSTPWEAGQHEGKEWAKSASSTSIRHAAERLTTNELIAQHLNHCQQCESAGEDYDGNLCITSPADYESDSEVSGFFQTLLKEGIIYRGVDEDIRVGRYAITRIPHHNLRQFEGGWTHAVRQHRERANLAEQF